MYLHEKVSLSRAALPAAVVFAVLSGLLAKMTGAGSVLAVVAVLACGFLVETLNVRHTLMRGFTRMTSCCFILFSTAVLRVPAVISGGVFLPDGASFPPLGGILLLVPFILYLLVIFYAYQQRQAPVTVFFAYVFIGVISIWFVRVLYFVPFLWLMTSGWLQAASLRNTAAMLLGLLFPYWFWAGHVLHTGDFASLPAHFSALAAFGPLCRGVFCPRLFSSLLLLTFFNLCGSVHFWHYSYNESIKNRMLHLFVTTTGMLSTVFVVLQPQHAPYLLPPIILSASVATAHYFAFSSSRAATWIFLFFSLAVVSGTVLSVCNI